MKIEPRPARAQKWSLSKKNLVENQWKSSPGQPGPQNGRFLMRIYYKIDENRAPFERYLQQQQQQQHYPATATARQQQQRQQQQQQHAGGIGA